MRELQIGERFWSAQNLHEGAALPLPFHELS
jgi:hypothetical protein